MGNVGQKSIPDAERGEVAEEVPRQCRPISGVQRQQEHSLLALPLNAAIVFVYVTCTTNCQLSLSGSDEVLLK